MNRQAARELAHTTLSALSVFALVTEGAARSVDGKSPVATVLSKGLEIRDLTRDGSDEVMIRLSVTIYERCDIGDEESTEDRLDSHVEAAAKALRGAGFLVGESDANADGAPLRAIDGVLYRAERIPLTYEEWE